jgi:hypothetical protein
VQCTGTRKMLVCMVQAAGAPYNAMVKRLQYTSLVMHTENTQHPAPLIIYMQPQNIVEGMHFNSIQGQDDDFEVFQGCLYK